MSDRLTVHVDLFDDRILADPYPMYRDLRKRGDVVYLEPAGMWLAPRYSSVREILARHDVFGSGEGVGFDLELNGLRKGSVLASDPPGHTRLRKVLSNELGPPHLRHLEADIQARADALVDEIIGRGRVDGISDLAARFPLSVVADLIGLPHEGRERLLTLADGAFNTFGPRNQRTEEGLDAFRQVWRYVTESVTRETITPGSMGMAVYTAADRGDISEQEAFSLLTAYLIAGMDTTVNSIGHGLWLLGTHAGQWELLRRGEVSVQDAFNEIMRFESPVYGFSRQVRHDHDFESARVPAGSRIGVLFGSANRDERMFPDPDRFDLTRCPSDQLGFGYGIHSCAGQGLARLENHCLLRALTRKVRAIETGEPARRLNNVIRGLQSLPLELVPG